MHCKYCGKEYKSEIHLLKHEAECNNKVNDNKENVSSSQVLEEIEAVSKSFFDPNSVEGYRKDIEKFVEESNKDSKFAYISLRNFKR